MGDKRLKRQLITNHSLLPTERKAFTLIELLVVISVIAVLMAVLLPALGRVRKQAQSVRCQAHLKHLAMAVAVYVADEGTFPGRPAFREPGMSSVSRVWELLLGRMDMEDKQDIMLCPVAKRTPDEQPVDGSGGFRLHGGTYHAWWYGGYQDIPEMRGSYAYNPSLHRINEGRFWNEGRTGRPRNKTRFLSTPAEIKKPSTVPMMLDSQWLEAWFTARGRGFDPPPSDNGALGKYYDIVNAYSCINRHHGGVNAVFVDSSVRKVGLKELWTLNWHRRFDTANKWTTAGGVQPEDWPEWMRGFRDY